MTLDFDSATLPWVDRESFPQESDRRVAAKSLSADDVAQLMRWRHEGYIALPGAIETTLIDELLAEYEKAWEERPDVKVEVENKGVQSFAEVAPRSELTHHHFRMMDFQDVSSAARRVMFHPNIVRTLALIFDQAPVAMQSLFFEYGSEQGVHQDFPYVQAKHLSHLIGCWVALEDVTADSGPLFYYPGSHRLPKFDWGGGNLCHDGKDEAKVKDFGAYLSAACGEAGLDRLTFHARKGDVFLWHAALVHGGSAANDRDLTRKSFVIHFSTREGYPRDRRWPDLDPTVVEINGGYLYEPPPPPTIPFLRQVKSKLGALARKLPFPRRGK